MEEQPKQPSFDKTGAIADTAGSLAGAGVGLAFAGPIGALAGAAAGPALSHTLRAAIAEFQQRVLSRRETVRVETILTHAAARIGQHQAAGRQLRADDFFDAQPDDRAPAEEIFEGVVLAAQREYQEKKLPFYGNLFANIAYRADVDRDLANALIRSAERLSYRQLCILSVMVCVDAFPTLHLEAGYVLERVDVRLGTLLTELYDLTQQGILHLDSDDSSSPGTVLSFYGVLDLGKLLFELMELSDLPQTDVHRIVELLPHKT